jgi:hypothetical protein
MSYRFPIATVGASSSHHDDATGGLLWDDFLMPNTRARAKDINDSREMLERIIYRNARMLHRLRDKEGSASIASPAHKAALSDRPSRPRL